MTINIRELPLARVIDVAGDIDLCVSPDLRKALFDAVRHTHTSKVGVNLQGVSFWL